MTRNSTPPRPDSPGIDGRLPLRPAVLTLAAFLLAAVSFSCVNIIPLSRESLQAQYTPDPSFWSLEGTHTDIHIRLHPCLDHEEYIRLLDADFTRIGVLVCFMEVENRRHETVDMFPASLRLRCGSVPLEAVPIHSFRKKLFRYYQIKAFSPVSFDKFLQTMALLSLRPGPIAPGARSWGIVFLHHPGAETRTIPPGPISLEFPDLSLGGTRTHLTIPLQKTLR